MDRREVIKVAPEQLEPDLAQVRGGFSEESLLGLAKTMEAGQLQPILAYRRNSKLIILDGERRWRAATLAKLATVDVVVVDEPTERGGILQRQLIANLQREDLAPLEKARAIDRLMKEAGLTAAKVALSLGMSPASVSRTLALLTLSVEVQERVAAGDLPASTAYQIARTADPESQQRLAAQVVEKGLSRDALVDEDKKRRKHAAASGNPTRVSAVLGGGRTITLIGTGLATLDDLVQWLEELLAKARKARPKGVALATFASMLKDEVRAAAKSPQGGV